MISKLSKLFIITTVAIVSLSLVIITLNYTSYFVSVQTSQTNTTIQKTMSSECSGTFQGVVERVIDGDTLDIQGCDVNVRLSLSNTPEYFESGYQQANSFTIILCKGSTATIDQDDLQPYDKYNRILALVYCQNKKLNAELVYNNLATIDTRFCSTSEFANESWAKDDCFPKTNETFANCFSINTFHYDAYGNDNYNLNDEYFILENMCNYPIDMTSWTIRDFASHTYMFPPFMLNPQATLTLYSGYGTDTSDKLYWNRVQAIWNNDGDNLFLKDKEGNLVFSYSY